MRSRGLAIAVAFMLAATATTAVFLYVKGVQEEAETDGTKVEIVVSSEDIPAGTELDPLLSEGAFETMTVPEENIVPGAVTSLSELTGKRTSGAVLAGEQITTARLQGSGAELPGGVLGIAPGHQALTVPLELPRTVGPFLKRGDHIALYGTFSNPEITVTLVPDVEVLRVSGLETALTSDSSTAIGMVTLSLEPQDGTKVVFAQETGKIWFALLPPNEEGRQTRPVIAPGVTARVRGVSR
jgi:Flp pilus assembly protein CpaB